MEKQIILASLMAIAVTGIVVTAPMAPNIDLNIEKKSPAVLFEKILMKFPTIIASPKCTALLFKG